MQNLRRTVGATALPIGLSLAALTAAPAQDQAFAAGGCSVSWGSTTKTADEPGRNWVANLRSGKHECYDRLVLDVDGSPEPSGYRVS